MGNFLTQSIVIFLTRWTSCWRNWTQCHLCIHPSSGRSSRKKQHQVLQFMRHVARRVRFDDPQFPHIIIAWALMVPISGEVMSQLLPDDYMLEDLRYVANLLLIQIDSRDTSRETQLKCIRCLRPIAEKMSVFLPRCGGVTRTGNSEKDAWYILLEWVLRIPRPWEAIHEFVIPPKLWDIVDVLLMLMSAQHEYMIKCIQCLQALARDHATWCPPRCDSDGNGSPAKAKAVMWRLLVDQIMLELGTLTTEELGVVVDMLKEELYKLDTSLKIRKLCIKCLQAIGEVSDLAPISVALGDIGKHIIKVVVTQTLECPKPWELIIKLDKDGYQFAVDILQENLDSADTSLALRASSIKCLQAVSRVSDVVPSSFILKGIKKKGKHSLFRGGFADIWQGRLDSGALVCLKVLRTFNTSYYDTRENDFKAFHREALIWRQLQHPRIHPFLGIIQDIFPDQLCLVSPWSTNGNLCDFLKGNPEMDRLQLLIEVVEGIDYLHSHDPQIVHADIRGVNILVKDDYTCCLADFGLSMITETQAPTTTRMRSGATRWMPPEVLDTRNDVFTGGNHKSTLSTRDIYSFGCTVIEIFSGNVPFSSIQWDIQVLTEVVMNKATPSRPSTIRLTDDIWRVAASCLLYDHTMRPSIQKVLSQLRTCYEEPGGWLQASARPRSYADILSQTPGYLSVAATDPLPRDTVDVRKIIVRAKPSDDSVLQLEVGILHDPDHDPLWTLMNQSNPPYYCDRSWHFSQSVLEIKSREITWWDESESANFVGFVDALNAGDRVVLFSKEGHDIHDISIEIFFQLE